MDWADRIGSRLKLRDLHILLAVVEWRSMAKAARHLAVSQPVVSRAIADLEQGLGVRLLDRTPQGVEPTIYGRTVLNRGLAVFDELRGSVKDIGFLLNPMAGELRIGSDGAIAGGLLAAVLDRLSSERPRIAFQVKLSDVTMPHYNDLRERNVDLLIGRLAEQKEDDVNAEVLFEDRLYVVAGTNSRWASLRKIALKDLVDEPWRSAARLLCGRSSSWRPSGQAVWRPPHHRDRLYHSVANCADGHGTFFVNLSRIVLEVQRQAPWTEGPAH